MRSPPWLAGYLLVVSCTVNTANLNVSVPVDAAGPGTGGQSASGGQIGTGGQVASGGHLGTGGQLATGGQVGTGGQPATGGQPGTGGESATGGQPGTGGQVATGGQVGTGGQLGAGGQVATGGQVGTGGQAATGGQVGTGGQLGTGGQPGTGGASGHNCSQLQTEYADALAAAKACTIGAGPQCRQLADTSIACPGCRVYVNDATELDTLKAQWTSSGCAQSHGICPAIACIVPSPATCTGNTGARPPGPGTTTAGTCSSNPFGN